MPAKLTTVRVEPGVFLGLLERACARSTRSRVATGRAIFADHSDAEAAVEDLRRLELVDEEHVLEEEWDWERTDLRAGEVLVVVCQLGDPDQVREVFDRHDGRLVSKPAYID